MNRDNDNAAFRPDWPKTCDRCRGTGTIGGHGDLRICPDCNGSGLPKGGDDGDSE